MEIDILSNISSTLIIMSGIMGVIGITLIAMFIKFK